MKKMKWLRKLPILALALIIAVSPLLMAVPAKADVLSGGSGYYSLGLMGNHVFVDSIRSNIVGLSYLNSVGVFYIKIITSDLPIVLEEIEGQLFVSSVSAESQTKIFFGSPVFPVDLRGGFWWPFTSDDLSEYEVLGIATYGDVSIVSDSVAFAGIELSYISGLGVLSVFSGVGSWLSGAIQSASTMFWTAESGMTVLGYLAVASLALAVILLIFSLIAGWLKFH